MRPHFTRPLFEMETADVLLNATFYRERHNKLHKKSVILLLYALLGATWDWTCSLRATRPLHRPVFLNHSFIVGMAFRPGHVFCQIRAPAQVSHYSCSALQMVWRPELCSHSLTILTKRSWNCSKFREMTTPQIKQMSWDILETPSKIINFWPLNCSMQVQWKELHLSGDDGRTL